MFGKVKNWLGIEGAKIELIVSDEIYETAGSITGKIRFSSMHEQRVRSVKIVLIERYSRGRRGGKLTDEYELGKIELHEQFTIPANQSVETDFTLPFKIVKSEMDELQGKNIFAAGLAKAAKLINGVNSTFRLEAEARVEGVALNPIATVAVNLV